jgi:lysozyme family protein
MADFHQAHAKTSPQEGGYSKDINDNGKETYRGISRVFHPYWRGWYIIDAYKRMHPLKRNDYIPNVELDKLVDIFYEEYFWKTNRLSEFTNQDVANEVFDTGVNMGSEIAAKFLQTGLNLLNRNEKDFKDIEIDGKIGSETIAMVNQYPRPQVLLKVLNGLQFSRYVAICERDPKQENNFLGWLNRV